MGATVGNMFYNPLGVSWDDWGSAKVCHFRNRKGVR
ncbi:hypothetical protein SAMN05216283_10557 [Sunxiuqinia elliptica]|uniref:Uncharacterized protein n=1 Tax=Sunxiuqinia elliptica TaxID=655355 RepID=A0A1I2I2B1_9BACT|nr:hypothetical protein SAMN05216283_10557 [Sunxiuqinia elliptica]